MITPNEENQHYHFLEQFTAHEPAIRAYIRRLLPTRSDADDVLQETVVVLWQKFGEFDKNGEFRAWAFGIAKMKALSWYRDKGRDRICLGSDIVKLIADESLAHDTYLEKQRHALDTCTAKLPSDQRDILMKAYQPDSTIEKVATESGRTIKAFYQWLYRIRRMLLDCIKQELRT